MNWMKPEVLLACIPNSIILVTRLGQHANTKCVSDTYFPVVSSLRIVFFRLLDLNWKWNKVHSPSSSFGFYRIIIRMYHIYGIQSNRIQTPKIHKCDNDVFPRSSFLFLFLLPSHPYHLTTSSLTQYKTHTHTQHIQQIMSISNHDHCYGMNVCKLNRKMA